MEYKILKFFVNLHLIIICMHHYIQNRSMDTEVFTQEEVLADVVTERVSRLILHNDDFNTFDWVIETLVTVCRHSTEQAEQCAHIVHYNGKCQVKHGKLSDMTRLCRALEQHGLTATVDE